MNTLGSSAGAALESAQGLLATSLLPRAENASEAKKAHQEPSCRGHLIGPADRLKSQVVKAATRAAWPPVREVGAHFTRFHKALLAHYGLKQIPAAEPASVKRLRQLLRRAGVSTAAAQRAVGCTLERYLELNPGWPLWHLVAATLEAYSLAVAEAVLAVVNGTEVE